MNQQNRAVEDLVRGCDKGASLMRRNKLSFDLRQISPRELEQVVQMVRTRIILAAALAALFGLTAPSAALAQGDAAKGSGLFARCTVCHSNAQSAPNRVGPNLFGVVGRKAGTVAGYNYSPAMKAAGFIWTQDALAKYLQSPSAVVPSNKMPFGGFSNAQQADDMAAYLATLK